MKFYNARTPTFAALTVAVLLLAACASKPPAAPATSRYSILQDRAPSRAVDLASIPDVVPEPVNRNLRGNKSPYIVLGKTYTVMSTEEGYSERGIASWYGEKFHGHDTSNGEVFDMYKVSAAHKSLPIPSFLRVTNLDNNRSIIVRVNDRGPFHGDRVIDLSYAAALKLGFADRGTARVQLEAIMPPSFSGEIRTALVSPGSAELKRPGGNDSSTYLQVGAFSDRRAAEKLSDELRDLTSRPVFILSIAMNANQTMHRVRVGPIDDRREVQQITDRVVAANLGSPYTVSE
jgi:rare lipoprotein A